MRVLRLTLAITGFALVVGLLPMSEARLEPANPDGGASPKPGEGPPQTQGDQFQFKVCNTSRRLLFIAIIYKVSADAWRSVGWASYKTGLCAPLKGTYPRNDFYWYAENATSQVIYSGKDAYGCIDSNASFDRTITGDYQCGEKERVVGFTKIDEASIRDGIALSD